MATKPNKLPLRPVFPITAPPKTPREGRHASPISWGGTPNLTDAQAKALRKEQKRVQKTHTDDAVAAATLGVNVAMHASGSAPGSYTRMITVPFMSKRATLGTISIGHIG